MNKEFLYMQKLAGIITEGQYKAKLNEEDKKQLPIVMYTPNNGTLKLDDDVYLVSYSPPKAYADESISITPYDKFGNLSLISPSQKDKILSYLDSFNISYKIFDLPHLTSISIDKSSLDNIKLIPGGEEPKFLSKDQKSNFKTLDFFIKRDNPDWKDDAATWWSGTDDIYDFGGGEGPISSEAVVVDVSLTPKQKNNPSRFIEADLSQYIKLPPKKIINISSAVPQINSPSNLAKTIKHALKPGGFLVIKDHIGAVQDLLKYLKDFKLLEISYVDVENPNNLTPSDQVFVALQK